MDPATRALVRTRAGNRCEYCLIHQDYAELSHHVEHIVAIKHGGLCLAATPKSAVAPPAPGAKGAVVAALSDDAAGGLATAGPGQPIRGAFKAKRPPVDPE